MVGGGQVAAPPVPGLIAAGADVHVVSPHVTPPLEGLAGAGEGAWLRRGFAGTHPGGGRYVIAATDGSAVNAAGGAPAETRHL